MLAERKKSKESRQLESVRKKVHMVQKHVRIEPLVMDVGISFKRTA
jgi:septum formation topological specificity factor MinE